MTVHEQGRTLHERFAYPDAGKPCERVFLSPGTVIICAFAPSGQPMSAATRELAATLLTSLRRAAALDTSRSSKSAPIRPSVCPSAHTMCGSVLPVTRGYRVATGWLPGVCITSTCALHGREGGRSARRRLPAWHPGGHMRSLRVSWCRRRADTWNKRVTHALMGTLAMLEFAMHSPSDAAVPAYGIVANFQRNLGWAADCGMLEKCDVGPLTAVSPSTVRRAPVQCTPNRAAAVAETQVTRTRSLVCKGHESPASLPCRRPSRRPGTCPRWTSPPPRPQTAYRPRRRARTPTSTSRRCRPPRRDSRHACRRSYRATPRRTRSPGRRSSRRRRPRAPGTA